MLCMLEHGIIYSCGNFQQDCCLIKDTCIEDSISLLLGDWGIYSSRSVATIIKKGFIIYDSTETVFNGISRIRFYNNGSGIYYNINDTINIKWRIHNNNILLSFDCILSKKPFGDDRYYYPYKIYKMDSCYELAIRIGRGECILRKSALSKRLFK